MNPTVNAGSMADIAFLLLIFFLVSTEIMNEKGIPIILPPYTEAEGGPTITNNLLEIWINRENELLVDKVEMDVSQLRTATKNFVLTSTQESSSLIVAINSDEYTSFETYVQVYAELKQAYIEIWEKEAKKVFNKELLTLSKEEFEVIKEKYPLRISEVEKTNSSLSKL